MVTIAGSCRALVVVAACLAGGCTLAGPREEEFVRQNLGIVTGVKSVEVGCGSGWITAKGDVCATVTLDTGARLQFVDVGYKSFGSAPSPVRLAGAGGRSPLVVSCESQSGVAGLERSGLFGHHFTPALEAVPEAVRRGRDVIEELEFWPQCPQFWEVAGSTGVTYRYCAHATGGTVEPPPLPCAQSLDSTK